MSLELALSSAIGAAGILLAAWARAWFTKRETSAAIHDDQSAAMTRYLKIIRDLEEQLEAKDREIDRLQGRIIRLQMERNGNGK